MKLNKIYLRILAGYEAGDVMNIGSNWDETIEDFSEPCWIMVVLNEECGSCRFTTEHQLILQYPDMSCYRITYEKWKTEYNRVDPFAGKGFEELTPVEVTRKIVQVEEISWTYK